MHRGQAVTLESDVDAILIPDGTPLTLEAGAQLVITQTLGGTYTVMTDRGYLARVDGKHYAALGMEAPITVERTAVPTEAGGDTVEQRVWDAMRTCYDPEIPVNIVDLGLIYQCNVALVPEDKFRVEVQMTLTAPGCGMGDILKTDVEQKVCDIEGVVECFVDMVFDPPWNPEMMDEATRLELGLL